MSNTILLFMWGYQPYFRIAMESRAKNVLEPIAAELEPRALLVGIRTPEETDGHPVCVEPEDGDWDPSMFFGCADRAESIYSDHPGHAILYGGEPRMRDKPENIRRDSVRQAVREVLLAYDSRTRKVSFCGLPNRVGGYHVVPVLQFDSQQLAEYPRLPAELRFGDHVAPHGLLESAIAFLIREASQALGENEPGRFPSIFEADCNGILRDAGDYFCNAIASAVGDPELQGVFRSLNTIASLPDEGNEAIGSLLFAPKDSGAIDVRVRLRNPVSLGNPKRARKMIEVTGLNMSCVCRGAEGISAIGVLRNAAADGIFRVDFTGRYRWDLHYQEVLLMRSTFGLPGLKKAEINETGFYSIVRRLFQGIQAEAEPRLWRIVEAAMKQKHSTIIVLAAAAKEEAHRLKKQSLPIEPVALTPDLVGQLSSIDGALLVDPDAVCHAIGVTLDGMAVEHGDPSRGAGYNSALRYIAAAKSPTMCVVVSDDGYVDILRSS